MNDKRLARLGRVAFNRTKRLDELIAKLQNTTIGTISGDIDNIKLNIDNLYSANDIINTKINSIASIFGVTFNTNGTLLDENYSQHTHTYTDKAITDTEDGSGEEETVGRETGGVA